MSGPFAEGPPAVRRPRSRQVLVPRDLLEALADPEPCRYGGGCHAHGYLDLKPGEKCPQDELRELLEAAEDVAAADAAMDEYEADGRVSYPFEQVRAEADARDVARD